MASLMGEHRRAVELGRAAVAAIPAGTDDARRALLLERLRWFLLGGRRPARRGGRAQRGGAAHPDGPPSAARARLHAHRAALDMAAGRFTFPRATAPRSPSTRRGDGRAGGGGARPGRARLGRRDARRHRRGIAHLEAARTIAADVDNIEGVALGWTTLAALQERVGRAESGGRFGAGRRGGCGEARGPAHVRRQAACHRGGRTARPRPLGRGRAGDRGGTGRATHRPGGDRAARRGRPARHRARAGSPRRLGGSMRARTADDALGGPTTVPPSSPRSASWGLARVGRGRPRGGRRGQPGSPSGIRPIPLSARLLALAVRAEADVAARARAGTTRRPRPRPAGSAAAPRDDADGLGGRPRHDGARGRRRGSRPRQPWPGPSSPAAGVRHGPTLAGDREALDAAARPVEAAYARFREGGGRACRRGPRGPPPPTALRGAHAVATRVGATPLATEVATLARLARIELEAGGPEPGTPPEPWPASA